CPSCTLEAWAPCPSVTSSQPSIQWAALGSGGMSEGPRSLLCPPDRISPASGTTGCGERGTQLTSSSHLGGQSPCLETERGQAPSLAEAPGAAPSPDARPSKPPSPPDSSVHRILQARILEWVAIPFSRVSPQPRDRTSPALQAVSFPSELPGKFYFKIIYHKRRDEIEIYFLTSRAWMPFPPISFAPPLGICTGPWPVQGKTQCPSVPWGCSEASPSAGSSWRLRVRVVPHLSPSLGMTSNPGLKKGMEPQSGARGSHLAPHSRSEVKCLQQIPQDSELLKGLNRKPVRRLSRQL
ncbi:unnamed protein product, partial [Rangifer tarandus platyrhynchus]